MRDQLFLVLLCSACAGTANTKVQDHNSSRSNKSASFIAPPDPVLPMDSASAVSPRCVEVQITAGEEDPEQRSPGDPIPGLDVKLGRNPGGSMVTAPTDDNGVAHFCDLNFATRGAFVLTAEAEGSSMAISDAILVVRAPRYMEWIKEPADGHVNRALRSADGSCPQVRLRHGKVMAGGENGSSAAVAYRAGDPVHGVDVKLGLTRGGAVVASATTNTEGVATFCDLIASKRGAVSYEPWTIDDMDEGIVSNPLYQGNGNAGVNPLFEGRAAHSTPSYVGAYALLVSFTRQPPVKVSTGVAGIDCPVVRVVAASGFSSVEPFEEMEGTPEANVMVTLTTVPGGASTVVTTGADGTAIACGAIFGNEDGAVYLRATAAGARSAVSTPVAFAP